MDGTSAAVAVTAHHCAAPCQRCPLSKYRRNFGAHASSRSLHTTWPATALPSETSILSSRYTLWLLPLLPPPQPHGDRPL